MNISLLDGYMDFLFFTALNKCGNVDDANDLTQETLLSALTFISKGGVIENIKSWLVAVMNRKYYDTLRRKYKQPAVCLDEISEPFYDDDIAESIIRSEEAENIRREVAYLVKLYREVVVLYYMKNKSVEQIAEELSVPEGTVKSRLSKGRDKIRKGINDMDKYSNLSYEPKELHVSNSGNWGLNGEPMSLVNGDLLAQNILIAAYEEPMTEDEIARAIGVPSAYVEKKADMLVTNELMKRVGNKVYTDFIIYKPDDQFKHIPAQKKLVSDKFDEFWSPIQIALDSIRQSPAYKNLTERQQKKLELYLTMKYLDYSIFNAGKKVYGEQIFPHRPNGGRWIAFGSIKSDLPANPENQAYSYNGERHWYFKDYLNAKSICSHVYGTPLAHRPKDAIHKHNMGEGDLTQLIYITSENRKPSDAGYNIAFLENIPYYTEGGYFAIENGVTKADIPVIPLNEYRYIDMIMNETISQASESLSGILAEYLKDKGVPIPKHLTSVPGQKQYMNALTCIDMMIIYKAKEDGLILRNADYSCPAMVLVTEKQL